MMRLSYKLRLLISMSLVVVFLVAVISGGLYFIAKRNILVIQEDATHKVLAQIDYNITYMNEMIKNMAMTTYFDNNTIYLMTSKNLDIALKSTTLDRLDRTVAITPYLQSIVIYNQYTGDYWSTAYSQRDGVMQALRKYMTSERQIVKARLLPLNPEVFSYFVCEMETCGGEEQSTLIFNVRSEWLYNNIQLINQMGGHSGQIVLMDTQGKQLASSKQTSQLPVDSSLLMKYNPLTPNGEIIKDVVVSAGEKTSLMTYMRTINGWYVINIQDYDRVMGGIERFRTIVIACAISLLAIALLAVFFISQKLYFPIGKLFRQLKAAIGDDQQKAFNRDELAFISNSYAQVARNYQITKKNFAKQHQLRTVLVDSSSVTKEQFAAFVEDNRLNIDPTTLFRICVFKFDAFQTFIDDPYFTNKGLFRFAIVNIVEETFSQLFRVEMVDLLEDHFVLLISLPCLKERGNEDEVIEQLLKKTQMNILNLYRISLTASINETPCLYSELTAAYHSALDIASYRIVYGPMQVLTYEMVKDHLVNSTLRFPYEMEEKLSQLIKATRFNEVHLQLAAIFSFISTLRFDNQIHSIMLLVHAIHSTLTQIDQNRLNSLSIDLKTFASQVLDCETLQDIQKIFDQLIERIVNQMERNDDAKMNLIIDTVKKVLETEYMNETLCLQSIGATLKISHIYLGTSFKKAVGRSVADYLNDVRLSHAIRLLEDGNRSIKEIFAAVGFTNESNFYKLFKKHYGVTPKEYRMRRAIK